MTIFILLLLCLVIFLTARIKISNFYSEKRKINIPDETKSTPISRALTELIAIAGGIYLSLVMLVSFLNISVSDNVTVFGFSFEPLAAIAIMTALAQPWLVKLFTQLKKY